MTLYAGIYILNSRIRRLKFEAETPTEAAALALQWGIGIEGETAELRPEPLPVAYDVATACRLLGGISRKTISRELAVGNLERLPDTRRVLITRESLERRSKL